MTLQAADIIVVPYDDQYSWAGVQYARDSLHFTYDRMGLTTAERLRKIVAGVAFEMAFRRWLEAQQVPYDLLGATHFTERDRYDLGLGGRRCDLKSFVVSDRRQIQAVAANPSWLLDASALVPLDQFVSTHLGEKDIYIFGFVTGLEARRVADSRKALKNGAPVYLLHLLSARKWARPGHWHSLGRLVLKSNARRTIKVELGGLGSDRETLREEVLLEPGVPAPVKSDYHALLYLRVPEMPDGEIGVHSPALHSTPVIGPYAWKNIWLYGRAIYLCGWINKREFRKQSKRLPPGSRTKQYARTKILNRSLPVSQLRSLQQLVTLLRQPR